MRKTYQVLAILIPGLVLVQAATIAFALSNLFTFSPENAGFDQAALDSADGNFGGALPALNLHGQNGFMVIPLVALLLLIVSFWAKVPRGTLLAAVILGLVVVQVVLGSAHLPVTAAVHGMNALLIFGTAIVAARNARVAVSVAA